jgi:hypothetical protein
MAPYSIPVTLILYYRTFGGALRSADRAEARPHFPALDPAL